MLITGKLTLAYSNFFLIYLKRSFPKNQVIHCLMEIRLRHMAGRERTLKLNLSNIPECGFISM